MVRNVENNFIKIETKLQKSKYKIHNHIDYFKFTLYFSKKLIKLLNWNEKDILEFQILEKGQRAEVKQDCLILRKK